MSACWVCGQPSALHTPCFQSVPRGTTGHAVTPSRARLDRLPDVDERMADDQRVHAAGATADGLLDRDAGLLRTGHEVVDEDAEATPRAGLELLDDADEIVDAAEVFDHHALDTEVVAPDLLDEFGVVPAFDVDPARQCHPGLRLYRHRAGCGARRCGRRCTSRGGEDHGLAVDEVAGSDRERFPAAVPVLELHPAVLDANHGADVTGLGVLDDHADFHRLLGLRGAFGAGCWRGHRCHSDQPPGDRRVTPVLLNRDTAEGIANGTITLVLRRWDAPRAKAGGTQRTVAGTVRIDDVAEYPGSYRVTAAQARAAGYPDAKTAQQELDRRPAKHTYVITVSYLAPDERPELAADDRLVCRRRRRDRRPARRWDAAAETPWTREYLEMIGANEAVRAPDLAARVGLDVPRFKRRVRQLKGLGLTISLDVGYRLSPRGKAFLGR